MTTNKFKKLLISALLCLAPIGVMAQNEIGIPLRDFSGGINNNNATIALKANESPDAMNVVIDEPWGQAKTRNGSLTCGSIPSGNTITNSYEFIRSNGVHELILTDNTNIYSTIDCVNFSSVTTGLNSLAAPYFDTFFDKLWIVNKSTHPMTWDGTTLTLLDGVGTRPEPPLAQYVTHWKERVWMARTTTEPSAVYFTDLTDESGTNIDPSVSSAAWSNLNAIYIAQEDGSPIYGIKVYRDNLFVFKETGIWRIIFESNFDIQVVKSVSNVGCKFQDSIVELDNFLYFVGNDGIYKFDGNDVVRISDNIQATFNRLKQPASREGFELWDTAQDFVTGTLSNTSTSYYSGGVGLDINTSSSTFDNFSDGDYTSSPTWTFGGVNNEFSVSGGVLIYGGNSAPKSGYLYIPTTTTSYGYWASSQSVTFATSLVYRQQLFHFITDGINPSLSNGYALRFGGSDGSSTSIPLAIVRLDSGVSTVLVSTNVASYSISSECGGGACYRATCGFLINRNSSGNFSVTSPCLANALTTTDNTHRFTRSGIILEEKRFSSNLNTMQDTWDNIYVPTGHYVSGFYASRISTYSALSTWQSFDIDETLNGQTINYYVRTATSAYNVSVSTWQAITSGQVISTITANNYFQWKAELATTDTSVTPLIDAVTANYREGDATSTRLQAINYKNRYILTGSTTSANNFNDIVLVKTRTPLDSWMVYDWRVSSLTKWNNYLYGGISETDDVARFDYGTNDNGSAINAYWTWGDQHWDRLSYKKNLKEIYGFYIPTQSSANTYISYSYDGGTNWTDKTVDMTGTTAFGTKKLNINGGIGNAFRFKIGNKSLDQSFNVLGIDIWALPYTYRE